MTKWWHCGFSSTKYKMNLKLWTVFTWYLNWFILTLFNCPIYSVKFMLISYRVKQIKILISQCRLRILPSNRFFFKIFCKIAHLSHPHPLMHNLSRNSSLKECKQKNCYQSSSEMKRCWKISSLRFRGF